MSPFYTFFPLLAPLPLLALDFSYEPLNLHDVFFVPLLIVLLFLIYREKRLKKDLQDQKQIFKTIYEKSHDGILLIKDGKFIHCNEAIVKMLKYDSKEHLINTHPAALSPKLQPDGQTSFEKAEKMMQIALKEGYHQFHWVHTRADGENFWADIVLTKIEMNQETIIHVVWRDIQKQKELEEKIYKLNNQLEQIASQRLHEQNILLSLFDKGESILFKWNNDASWSVNYVSASIKSVLGYEREEFLEEKILYAECIHKEDLEQVSQEVQNAIEEKKEYFEHQPYRIYTKTGEIKWVLDRTVIVRDKEGEITHFVGYISDISDLKEKERQLIQQSKLAQMGEMLSMIAHQWRQPLSAISATVNNLSLKLMLDDYNRTLFQKEIALIGDYTQHLSKTIDDFKGFFKKDKTKETTTLEAIVKESLKIIEIPLKNRNIQIQTDFQCHQIFTTYANELKQVVLNLLKNAEDALIEKKIPNPYITIKTEKDDLDRILIIEDNAGGIPSSIQEKIYEPYFSTKLEKDGTGLGLYMSKIIVQEHCGGTIEVTNTKEGARFEIRLKDMGVLEDGSTRHHQYAQCE